MRKLAFALLALALVPATADAKRKPKPKYQRALFDVSVLIIAGTEWSTLSDDEAAECRTKTFGSGSENLYFKTAAPQRVSVMATRDLGTYVFGNLAFDGTATVEREGHQQVTVEDPCPPVAEGDGDSGGEPPPAPDCGTRTGPFGFDLSFTRKTVELVSDSSRGNYELFSNCPVQGTSYPDLLTVTGTETGYDTIRAPLALKDLMNPRKTKPFVIESGGELRDDLVDAQSTSRIGWKIVMKRVVSKPKR